MREWFKGTDVVSNIDGENCRIAQLEAQSDVIYIYYILNIHAVIS